MSIFGNLIRTFGSFLKALGFVFEVCGKLEKRVFHGRIQCKGR